MCVYLQKVAEQMEFSDSPCLQSSDSSACCAEQLGGTTPAFAVSGCLPLWALGALACPCPLE